jgi:hypothetical protein
VIAVVRALPESEPLDLLECVLTKGITFGPASARSIQVRRRSIVAAAMLWTASPASLLEVTPGPAEEPRRPAPPTSRARPPRARRRPAR